MRIAIVDYSGHAFTVQLSRKLASRGHTVRHLYFADFQSPHGRLEKAASDPATLTIEPLTLNTPFSKYSFFRRFVQEVKIGRSFAKAVKTFQPDIVLAGNCPLDVVIRIAAQARRMRSKFIFWQQDIYSNAISRILGHKLGFAGRLIGAYYRHVERRALRMSDATIVISQDFIDTIRQELTISARNVHVIENWAPLSEIPQRQKCNSWAKRNGVANKTVVLYSGTIGLKHDPQQLLDLASGLRAFPETVLVVVSEGPFAYWLAHQCALKKFDHVIMLPFQSHSDFPNVLASADIAVAILEADAGTFSVPSKILSYLCAGRPIVLSAPRENLASRIVTRSNAGLVVNAGDRRALTHAITSLISDKAFRVRAGRNARAYAEKTFDMDAIATRFEGIFNNVAVTSALPMPTEITVRRQSLSRRAQKLPTRRI